MRSNTSLLGRILLWIASEMLEILMKILRIIFKQNLCPWLILSRLGKVKPSFPFALAAPEFPCHPCAALEREG